MSDTIITSNVNDLYLKMLQIAQKYMDVKNNDILKAGFMGYMMEVMAMFMRDSILHRNMIYNEAFLNTASLPRSIYNWAKMFNINVITATPAKARVQITLNKEDVLNVSTTTLDSKYGDYTEAKNNVRYFVIDRNTPMYAGHIPFMLPKSLVITITSSSTGITDNITVRTASGEKDFLPMFNTPTYLKHVVVTNPATGDEYIVIVADVYQMYRVEQETIITSNNVIDNKIHSYTFTDQLVGVNMYYLDSSRNKYTINTYFNNLQAKKGERYCLFNLSDTNEFQITFTGLPGDFIPRANSILIAEYFTTLGSKGNVFYKGNLSYIFEDESYVDIPIMIKQIEQASGGIDTPSLDKIKEMIIESITTNSTIVTEGDLRKYFNNLSLKTATANQRISFRKKIDDITRRVFSAHVLFRDEDGWVVPTNTVDVELIPQSGDSNQILSKKPGSLVKFTKNINETSITERIYTFADATDNIESLLETYVLPFYMLIRVEPVPIVKYIYNSVNSYSEMNFDYVNPAFNKELIPSLITVDRDALSDYSDYYDINMHVTTNMTKEELEKLLLVWKIGDSDNPEKIVIHTRYNSNPEEPQNLKLNVVDTDEFFNKDMGIYGEYIRITYEDNGITREVSLRSDISITVDIYQESYTKENKIFTVSSTEDLQLFIDLDNVMTSDLEVSYDESGNIQSIKIREVPLILAEFFSRSANNNLLKDIATYANELKNSVDILETNTSFDMKFYNTYGLSYLYTSPTTNISLNLDIIPKVPITQKNISDIRIFIRDHVDNSNITGVFSVSQLIARLQEEFSDIIEYVEFKGMNNSFAQTIKLIKQKEQSIRRTPEFINVTDLNINIINS